MILGVSSKLVSRETSEGKTYVKINFSQVKNKSDEIFTEDLKNYDKQIDIFYYVWNFLYSNKLNVPNIFKKENEIIIMEDLGDQCLYKIKKEDNDFDTVKNLYKEAIDWIIKLQNINYSFEDIKERRLNEKIFLKEIHSFIDSIKLFIYVNPDDEIKYLKEFENVACKICSSHFTLIHRDFQSKNLFQYDDKLYVIDFQDTCSGPFTYDLASLLFDSNTFINSKLRSQLIDYYWDNCFVKLYTDKESFKQILYLNGMLRLNKSLIWRIKKFYENKSNDIRENIMYNLNYMTEIDQYFKDYKVIFCLYYKWINSVLNK